MAGATNPNTVAADRFVGLAAKLGQKSKIALLVAPYYSDVVSALEAAARSEIERAGFEIVRLEVPGALELPQALQIAALSDDGDMIAGAVMIGCVIRGETAHYDIVCEQANTHAMRVALEVQMPLGNALLTVDTHEQAMVRATGNGGGKGGDAARACLTLIELQEAHGGGLEDTDDLLDKFLGSSR